MKTGGQGNPKWSREETLLALRLYIECPERLPTKDDQRVQALSDLLRRNPGRRNQLANPSFRNPASVVFKLHNLRAAATGEGFENNSRLDRELWEELGHRPRRAIELAQAVETAIGSAHTEDPEVLFTGISELEFAEGQLVTVLHLCRERSADLRKRYIRRLRNSGLSLKCELCRLTGNPDDSLHLSVFEVHHLVPVSAGPRRTRLRDVALLCANCHRLIHRAITMEKRWLGLDEARRLLPIDWILEP